MEIACRSIKTIDKLFDLACFFLCWYRKTIYRWSKLPFVGPITTWLTMLKMYVFYFLYDQAPRFFKNTVDSFWDGLGKVRWGTPQDQLGNLLSANIIGNCENWNSLGDCQMKAHWTFPRLDTCWPFLWLQNLLERIRSGRTWGLLKFDIFWGDMEVERWGISLDEKHPSHGHVTSWTENW